MTATEPHYRLDGASLWLKASEAARLLRWDHSTVTRALQEGRLTGGKLGKRWRVRRDSVEALLRGLPPAAPAEKEPQPAPEPPAVERALALLAALTPVERKRLALEAITGLEV